MADHRGDREHREIEHDRHQPEGALAADIRPITSGAATIGLHAHENHRARDRRHARNVRTKVPRKSASGTIQRNGAEAMSVEICEVTAIR